MSGMHKLFSKSFIKKKKNCTVPVCIGPECILINALIQAQNNSVRTSKKNNIYLLLSLITFNAHQVPVLAFFCTMYYLMYFAPYTILCVTDIRHSFIIVA